MECKQIAHTGARQYLLDNYNIIDFTVLSIYLASYTLRFLADRWIKVADRHYNGTSRARDCLLSLNRSEYDQLVVEIFADESQPTHSYFMKACKCREMLIRVSRDATADELLKCELTSSSDCSGRQPRTSRYTSFISCMATTCHSSTVAS